MNQRPALLARYCAERTLEHRNAVVDAHRYLCLRGARKFTRSGNDRADLEQVAAVGLIKAADYYRTEMQTPFEAYAWIMVVGELMHYVRDHERLVRIPRSLRALEKRSLDAWDTFCAAHHREPTTRELATALGVGVEMVLELRALRRIDRAGGDADGTAPDPFDSLPDTRNAALEQHVALTLAMRELGERERLVVLGTYGAGLTQTELGARLGLSQSHISKVLSRALGKLGRAVA